jgi:alternative ribosome-rescue factor
MSKLLKRRRGSAKNQDGAVNMGRGEIQHNFLAALVTSSVYHQRIVRAKKGKGAYRRTNKDKGAESYLIAA